MNKVPGIVFVALSIGTSVLFIIIASLRDLTGLENTLLQVISLGLGLIGSYILGRESSKEMANELVKPHAKSAFRRLLSLYNSISRLGVAIQNSQSTLIPGDSTSLVLDKLQAMVIEQISTADDALEDWKDILPEELEKLKSSVLAAEAKDER